VQYDISPILSVKLKMPEPRKNYVIRKALFEKLKKINEYKVTIVKAGAGCGKTTLLSSFVKETNLNNVKWVALDDNMNQTFVFWKYVLESLKDYFGKESTDFQTCFDGNMQKENLWQMLSLFMNKLCTQTDIILVLDDFHFISETFLISTIDYFIKNMPNNMHLVFLTRELPNIYLGTLSLEDRIMFIDENIIKLSEVECRQFLLDTLGLDKNEEQLKSMIEASEGWIGGLQLMAIAIKDQSSLLIHSLRFSSRIMEDYITKEIFQFLTEEEQNFLTKTAILRYFNEKICKQYLPECNFRAIMEAIFQKNLFVISIDDEAGVYRYHAILSEYLNGNFEKLGEESRRLHILAADIYYKLGDYEESLHHLFAIKEYQIAMTRLLKMPQTSLTFTYMMKVPMEEIANNTDFAYQYFFCYYVSMEFEACEKIYSFITKNMKQDKTYAAFKHADMFYSVNWDFKKINVLSLEQIHNLPLNPVTMAYLLIKEAYFLYAACRNQEAMEYLDKAEKVYKETGNSYIGFFILSEKAQILEDIGELNQCLQIYKAMEPFIEKLCTLASSYYIGIAGLYTKRMALNKANEALMKAKASITKEAINMYSAYESTLAEYSYVIGDYEKTEKILTNFMEQDKFQNIIYSARLLRYPIYHDKHTELAKKFAKDYSNLDDFARVLDTELVFAGIQYEYGSISDAMVLVDKIIAKARKTQNKLKIVEGDLLKAKFLLENQGNKREIQNLFIEAVSYACSNVIAIPFWFEKKTVEAIIQNMYQELQNKLSDEEWIFINSILKAEPQTGLEEGNGVGFGLTERENEVLYEMANGCTNKQIAENLYISLATVKSHIINIYGKLGVNNRVAAINKVKQQK
jgi:LuxR family transcriptional regulator, maltose regulon positive regulatory protein